jgi:hypothetical protein
MGTILWTKISYFHPIQQSVNLRGAIYHNNILLIYMFFLYVANTSSEIYICHRKKWNFGRGWVWNNFHPNTHWESFFEQVSYNFTQSNKVQTLRESFIDFVNIHLNIGLEFVRYVCVCVCVLHRKVRVWNKLNPLATILWINRPYFHPIQQPTNLWGIKE